MEILIKTVCGRILQCGLEVIWSSIVWQVVRQYVASQLLSEEIHLVEEYNEGGFLEED